jgi:hypothetical protein
MGPKTLPTIWGAYMKLVTKYQISAINSCWEKCDEKCAYMFNVYRNQLSRQTGSRNLTCPKTLPTIWYTYMMLFTDLLSCNWHVKSCAIYTPNAYKVIKLTSSVPRLVPRLYPLDWDRQLSVYDCHECLSKYFRKWWLQSGGHCYTPRNKVVGGYTGFTMSVCRQILCRTITWVVCLRIF